MYEIRIHRTFHASHALRLYDGSLEESHAHDWQVFVHLASPGLDTIEVVMDFHELERIVAAVLAPMEGRSLNGHPMLAGLNPSAERVAEAIYRHIEPQLPPGVKLTRVTVTEAPGCQASYLAP